ncbi:hypothetical protein [Nocardia sp. CC201C]|uniref:hypothetical protein n=1 Tax=Nocardia sp. CC201C TaxID=3044575 RepID=UPI0024A91C59|nr:hypothetical protein [Nocardia sp. CC201C]
MTETVKIDTTVYTTTTHRTRVEFPAAELSDLLLDDLRAAVAGAAHMAGDAAVSFMIDGSWRTPTQMVIERIRTSDDASAHHCSEHCDPGNCATERAAWYGPWLDDEQGHSAQS